MLRGLQKPKFAASRWNPARKLASVSDLNVGSVLHGFKVKKIKAVPDFDLTAIQLKHEKTGADYLHIAKDDSNNVFTVGFQTTPKDSTGVPHILEHTTLCGSQKYPVRDPFFKMPNRSMSTFMNAMTGSDITMYPFSTENPVDFDNLLSVYMDAVFHPLLRELDFKQEGWRLEHEVPSDPSTPLTFKGVVYNEMKGVYSDVNNIFLTGLQTAMYPNTTYCHNSGGDPVNITDLTYEQLLEFHRKHYHPSNAKFLTYGNFPLEKRLAAVNEVIRPFDKIEVETIKDVVPFDAIRRLHVFGPPEPMGSPEKQSKFSISYLTNDGTDSFETFAVRMLVNLLIDGPSSPMYRALIESNIGTDYVASTGYDRTARRTNFSIGLQGISKSDFTLVEEKIRTVFLEAMKTGFEAGRIESAIHQIELGIRHRRANFGMGLVQSVIQQWVHGGDPIDALEVTKFIKRLRVELATPGFFESRIEKYFVNNSHQLIFSMEPSDSYTGNVQEEEKSRLQKKIDALNDSERAKILEDGMNLAKIQETKEDISCLPSLTIKDVSVKSKTYPASNVVISDFSVQARQTATNGISYVTVERSVTGLKDGSLKFVPLYCNALTALGTTSTPSVPELDDKIRMYTSGIHANILTETKPETLSSTASKIHFDTSFIGVNRGKAFELLGEIIEGPGSLTAEMRDRLKTVISGMAASGMNSLADSGHRYAIGLCAANLSQAAKVRQMLSGIESVRFLNKLHESGDEGIDAAYLHFKSISEFILNGDSGSKGLIIGSEELIEDGKRGLAELAERFKWNSKRRWVGERAGDGEFQPSFTNTFIPLPFTVNYTARSYLGVPYTHPDSAAFQILAELMRGQFLHREVREKGGAYGGMSNYNSLDGLFHMASYRDPPGAGKRTIDAYDRAVVWASEITNHLGERELNEAKLSIFSSLDAPISASQESKSLFNSAVTDEERQCRRERILVASLKDVEEVSQKYLLSEGFSQAILGPAEEVLDVKSEWVRMIME